MAPLELPQGRNGRVLAVLITLLALALVWRAVAAPLLGWYEHRAEALQGHQALAARMALLVRQLPSLRAHAQMLGAAGGPAPGSGALIEGSSDAVASAAIQEKLSAMAAELGLTLSSTETLAGSREGGYRRIGVRVSMDASFPVVAHLLQSIEDAQPSLLVDDLQVHGTRLLGQTDEAPLNVALTVLGYRRADASPRRRPDDAVPDPSTSSDE